MKNFNKTIYILSTLLLASGSVLADDNETLQTRDRTQTHLNLQTLDADFSPNYNRNQSTTMVTEQKRFTNRTDAQQQRTGSGSGSMNRYRTMNQSVQNNTAYGSGYNGSMNRQSTMTRSMGGGRR